MNSLINHSMINQSDLTMANHEAAHAHEPWVLLKWCGWQPGFGTMPGDLYWETVYGALAVAEQCVKEQP